jgi:EAL domain-containing protein (putative c-di-GMP-specific phosphodiesterase class I)/AmiR/NasT family two-component response regulator
MDRVSSLRIILVDDDEFLVELMTVSLARLGLQNVETTSRGTEVLAMLESGKLYDVILIDLNMPEMDGIELMRHLAERKYSGGIIILTGEHPKILQTANSLAKAHNLRLLGFLQKPFEQMEVLELLNSFASDTYNAEIMTSDPVLSALELHEGIENGQIVPYFQPRVEISSHRIVGIEALARWQHPDKGLIMPKTFLPIAEHNGIIAELGNAMLHCVIRQGAEWLADGLDLKLAINVASRELEDISFPDRLTSLAKSHGFPLTSLVLELTESHLMENLHLTLDTLIRLRLKNVTLSVDDFGTGYSNLGKIKRAPFSELKIDRSFIQEGVKDEEGQVILEASILMGKKLGLTVVTEGIETFEEWGLVSALGADEVQGYLVAKPMPAEDIPEWIDHWLTMSNQITGKSRM